MDGENCENELPNDVELHPKRGVIGWARSHIGATIAIVVAIVSIVVGASVGVWALVSAAAVVPQSQITADLTSADISSAAGTTLSYVENDAYTKVSVSSISEARDKDAPDTVEGTCKVTLENTPSLVVANVSFTYVKEGDTWGLSNWKVTDKQVTARSGVDATKVQADLPALMAQADSAAGSTTSLESIYGTEGATLISNDTTQDGGNVTFALAVDDTSHSAAGTLTVAFAFVNGNWKATPSANAAAYAVTSKTKLAWVLTKVALVAKQSSYAYDTYQYDSNGQLVSKTWHGDDGGNATFECADGMVTSETYTSYMGSVTSLSYTYDTAGRCVKRTSLVTAAPYAFVDGIEVGRSTSCAFSYDGSNRLVKVSETSDFPFEIAYSYSGDKLASSVRTHLSGAQSSTTNTYSYDSNGNVATCNEGNSPSLAYTWEQIEVPATAKVFDGMNIVCELLYG